MPQGIPAAGRCDTGGFLGIGGSSAKTDRKYTLQGYGELGNVFNYALPTAETGVAAGQAGLGQAQDYYSKILSGNRPAALQAIAPEVSGVLGKEAATRRGIAASGTARGGGLASTEQQAHDQAMGEINNSLFGARAKAAQGETQVGQAQMEDALNALGLGEYAASDLANISAQSRKTSQAINTQTQQQVGGAILGALGGIF